jgi:ferredoxin
LGFHWLTSTIWPKIRSPDTAERRPTSRLSCHIKGGPELDGLTVRLPERQQ